MSPPGKLGQWRDFHGAGEPDAPPPQWAQADHKLGVSFLAPWEEPFAGFPEHGRRLALALHGAGVPVHLRSINGARQFTQSRSRMIQTARTAIEEKYAPLLHASIADSAVQITHTIGDPAALFRLGALEHPIYPPEDWAAVQSRQIVSTVFERDRVHPDVAAALRRLGNVWVANRRDEAMLRALEVPVTRVPLPYHPDEPLLELAGLPRRPGPPRFYHIGKWEPRKRQDRILLAFLLAFEPGEARLVIRSSGRGPKPAPGSTYHDTVIKAATAALEHPGVRDRWTRQTFDQHIQLITKKLSPERLRALHRQGDVYVSLSHGEGWDMPAFDAKLAGNRMVYTQSGGPDDYACPDDHCVGVVGASPKSIPCDPLYGWGDACYRDYDVADAVRAFRRGAAHVHVGRSARREAYLDQIRRRWLDKFSFETVGNIMKASIEKVAGGSLTQEPNAS